MSYSPYRPVRRKYGNKKVTIGGRTFDSKREAERYLELRSLMKSGYIYELECQKRFELIPKQTDSEGRCIERKCEYIADFTYKTQSGETIVEDTKGFRTPEYIIKRKLMLYVHGIRVREI